MSTLADTIRNIPPVTRFFTVSTLVVSLACSMQLISLGDLIFSTDHLKYVLSSTYHNMTHAQSKVQAVKSFFMGLCESYRFFTCFLVPPGLMASNKMEGILDIYFFYTFANNVERGRFNNNFADCLYFTLLTGTMIVVITTIYGFIDPLHFPFPHSMMLSCIGYIWSRHLKNSIINFLGIIPIKAYYLPFGNLFIKMITQGFPAFLDTGIGILGGYFYQCVQSDTIPFFNLLPTSYSNAPEFRVGTRAATDSDIIPDTIFDKGYLKAPLWFYNLLGYPSNNSVRTTAFRLRRPSLVPVRRVETHSSNFAGRGRRLGSDVKND